MIASLCFRKEIEIAAGYFPARIRARLIGADALGVSEPLKFAERCADERGAGDGESGFAEFGEKARLVGADGDVPEGGFVLDAAGPEVALHDALKDQIGVGSQQGEAQWEIDVRKAVGNAVGVHLQGIIAQGVGHRRGQDR